MKTPRSTQEPDAVAAYATATGAERAVSHLVSLGYDEHEVGIAPRDFHITDRHPLWRRLGSWLRYGAAIGALAGLLIELGRRLGIDVIVRAVVPAVAVGIGIGVVLGAVVAIVGHRRAKMQNGVPTDVLAPGRYDIVVGRDPDRARHGLAKWWDPAAPPSNWRQTA